METHTQDTSQIGDALEEVPRERSTNQQIPSKTERFKNFFKTTSNFFKKNKFALGVTAMGIISLGNILFNDNPIIFALINETLLVFTFKLKDLRTKPLNSEELIQITKEMGVENKIKFFKEEDLIKGLTLIARASYQNKVVICGDEISHMNFENKKFFLGHEIQHCLDKYIEIRHLSTFLATSLLRYTINRVIPITILFIPLTNFVKSYSTHWFSTALISKFDQFMEKHADIESARKLNVAQEAMNCTITFKADQLTLREQLRNSSIFLKRLDGYCINSDGNLIMDFSHPSNSTRIAYLLPLAIKQYLAKEQKARGKIIQDEQATLDGIIKQFFEDQVFFDCQEEETDENLSIEVALITVVDGDEHVQDGVETVPEFFDCHEA